MKLVKIEPGVGRQKAKETVIGEGDDERQLFLLATKLMAQIPPKIKAIFEVRD